MLTAGLLPLRTAAQADACYYFCSGICQEHCEDIGESCQNFLAGGTYPDCDCAWTCS
jgi:hypothetical protein